MALRPLATLAFFALSVLPARAQEPTDDWGKAFRSSLATFFLGPEKRDEFRWHGPLADDLAIEIKGVNGEIQAVASSGSEVEVVAVKRGRRNDPREVEIRVVPHPGGVTLCAVYPSPNPAKPNECAPGKEGRLNVRNHDVTVDFMVRVPRGVSLLARTVNGRIVASELGGNVEAATTNGSIRIQAKGHARARTVNGSIVATMGRTDWTGSAEFRSVNGSVTVAVPSNGAAELRAGTTNGSVSNELSLRGSTRATRTQLVGTLGAGGRELVVRTVNGAIRLRSAS